MNNVYLFPSPSEDEEVPVMDTKGSGGILPSLRHLTFPLSELQSLLIEPRWYMLPYDRLKLTSR